MSLAKYGPIASHDTFSDPKAYAEHLMTQSKSSFTLGMKAMAKPRREAIFAVYAFCRAVDDIADEPGDVAEKRDLLSAWREEVAAIYDNKPQSLIGRSLANPIETFKLPQSEFLSMIDGMEADVNGPITRPTFRNLMKYTRQVAGTVGKLSIRIFGVQDTPARDPFALSLADALQLTNILRDIKGDAQEGRLYLPDELLTRHNIKYETPEDVAAHENIIHVRRDLGRIARVRFTQARRHLTHIDKKQARPALMMMGVYEGHLDQMEKHEFNATPSLYKISRGAKLTRALRYGFFFPKRDLKDDETTLEFLEEHGCKAW